MPAPSEPAQRPRVVSPDTLRGEPRDRTPPGQVLTAKWPVLHYGKVPKVDPRPDWRCGSSARSKAVRTDLRPNPGDAGGGRRLRHALRHALEPAGQRLHRRAARRRIIERAKPQPDARFVMCHSEAGFTVNVPLEEFTADDCILAYQWDGKDLTPDHGWPLRGLVPRLYLWKSAKWIRGIELRATDAPGFWEQNGYHMHGDPWAEERFGW